MTSAPPHPAPPHPAALRFAELIALLREALGECGGRRVLAGTLAIRLWARFRKMSVRFAALVAHLVEFGADAPMRARRKPRAARPEPPAPPPPPPPSPPAPPQPTLWAATPWGAAAAAAAAAVAAAAAARLAVLQALPNRVSRRFAWLASMDLKAAAAGSRLRALLEDPEVAAMLAISPRMRKLLRPLGRMLGVKLPPVPKSPRTTTTDVATTTPTSTGTSTPTPTTPGTPTSTGTDPEPEPETDADPPPPRRRRQRLWRPPSRRSDMMTLLRMGTPLVET